MQGIGTTKRNRKWGAGETFLRDRARTMRELFADMGGGDSEDGMEHAQELRRCDSGLTPGQRLEMGEMSEEG